MQNRLPLMARKRLVPGYSALYLFNEGAGQVLYDRSGNGYHGTLGSTTGDDTNDPAWGATGLTSAADDWVTFPSVGTGPMTAIQVITFTRLAVGGTENRPSRMWYLHNANNLVYLNGGNWTAHFAGSTPTINTPAMHTTIRASASIRDTAYRVNLGAPFRLVNSQDAPQPAYDGLCGVVVNGGSFDGTFHAAVTYPRVLSASEIAQCYAYLKTALAPRGVVLP